VGEHRDHTERDRDRRQGDQQRDQSGHNGPEDEQQDDQGGGKTDAELTVLQIALRELVEVAVERLLAGDRDREGRLRIGAFDRADNRVDAVIRGLGELHHRRVPIPRHKPEIAVVEIRANAGDAGLTNIGCEPSDECLELRCVDRVPP
jgi:hypothetical protein